MREVYYYKGLYKVAVITESEGYWIVEALEEFKDCLDGEQIVVKVGERRIVQPGDLVRQDSLPPIVSEHEYELKLEEEVKHMVEEYDKEKG